MSNIWLRKVDSWSMEEILDAVDDADWQAFRLSLKGKAQGMHSRRQLHQCA